MTDEQRKRSDNRGGAAHEEERRTLRQKLLEGIRYAVIPKGVELRTKKDPSRDDIRKAAIAARPSKRQTDRLRLATRLTLALEEKERRRQRKAKRREG